MDNRRKEIRAFLENLPDEFDILQERVNIETQKEYIDYSHSFGTGELSEKVTHRLIEGIIRIVRSG